MNTTTASTDNGLNELNGRSYDPCREALSPERGLARNLQTMTRNAGLPASMISLDDLTAMLEAQNQAAANGDLSHVRRLLSNQVTMLERLTDHLFSRAMGMGAVVDVYERYLKLAFRAQAQCVRTATLLKKMTDSATAEAKTKTQDRQGPATPASAPRVHQAQEGGESTADAADTVHEAAGRVCLAQ